jgi:ribose 5-phosphate isomerase A
MANDSHEFHGIAAAAVAMIPDGCVVGLGTGKAATAFIHALGERVKAGLRVRGIPTSQASAELATELGIPLTTFDEAGGNIEVAVDGADEVDPQLDLIKGYGGALVREKVVAEAARRFVVLVGPEKLVPVLGTHGTLPVEVVPFALTPCRRRIAERGLAAKPRLRDGQLFVTDNGNVILDCRVAEIERPAELDQALRAIAGVVGTGLFVGMAQTVLIGRGDAVEVRNRTPLAG